MVGPVWLLMRNENNETQLKFKDLECLVFVDNVCVIVREMQIPLSVYILIKYFLLVPSVT